MTLPGLDEGFRIRKSQGLKGPAKRTEEDDKRFAESFERMIQEALNDGNIAE